MFNAGIFIMACARSGGVVQAGACLVGAYCVNSISNGTGGVGFRIPNHFAVARTIGASGPDAVSRLAARKIQSQF